MDTRFLEGLDEYFCANYSDYVKLAALEGYEAPDVLYIEKDGNIARRDSSLLRLDHQPKKEELLATFKAGYIDTDCSFNFSVPSYFARFKDKFRKYTFAKVLKMVLAKYGEKAEGVGEQLSIEPRFWKMICKGALYPEKCTVLAVALVCRLRQTDFRSLLNVCGFELKKENVRDVVVSYLMEQKIFNPEMRDRCLAEYKITHLPLRRG